MNNDINLEKMTKKELKKLINPVLVDNDRLVRRTLKSKARVDRIQNKHEDFLKKNIYSVLDKANSGKKKSDNLQKFSMKTIDGKYKMQIIHKDFIRLNENAELAKKLVDEYIEKHLATDDKDGDPGQMISFLRGIFESKRKMTLNSGLIQFSNMKFTDAGLRKAQDLLKASMDADKSKMYVNIYKKTEKGWEKVEDASKEEGV